jgi:hypothetical protein
MRSFALAVVLICVAGAQAGAQSATGHVRDASAARPLPGAIVTSLDSAGRTIARAISDEEGRFTVALPPNASRLRVIRIGYRPRDIALRAPREATFDIAMEHLPAVLEAVRVSDKEVCPGSPERGAAFEVWQQARDGLLATVVARELKPADATTLTYRTVLAPGSERVRLQTKKETSGRTTRPFVASATPAFFARMGYAIEDNGTRVYSAPDADVLVDESFAATHCFRLRRDEREHPGQVGVAFTPIRGRDTIIDVQGAIWIDADNPRLRSLDFVYTSIEPAAMEAGAGGHIEFRSMPNGVSFVEWWNLRMAALQQTGSNVRRNIGVLPRRRTDLTELRVHELIDEGGAVLDAEWSDGTSWRAQRSAVTGVVVEKGSGTPIPYGLVTLAGTEDTVRTDEGGRFRIETVPGRYMIEASDTTLAKYVAPRSRSTSVEVRRGDEATVRLEVPSRQNAIDAVCGNARLPAGSAMITGAVAFSTGELPRDLRMTAVFQDILATTEAVQRTQMITPDDHGRFIVCGVPRDRMVRLTLFDTKHPVADTSVVVPPRAFSGQVLWLVKRP